MTSKEPSILDGAPENVVAAFKRLSGKQRVFVLALPTAASHEAAMVQAGYTETYARKRAGIAAKHPDVVTVLNWIVSEAVEAARDSVERVLRELCDVSFTDPLTIFDEADNIRPIREWPEDMRRALAGIEVFEEYQGRGKDREFIGRTKKVKFWNKLDGLEKVAKIKGYMQPEKVEHTHRVEGLAGLLAEIDGSDTGPGPASSRRA